MNEKMISIDETACLRDGLCVKVCQKVFDQTAAGSVPTVSRPEYCNGCGHCVLVCPSGAIRHGMLAERTVHAVNKDLLPSAEQVLEMIRSRRSIRNFEERPVGREVIVKIIDAACLAPSAKNTQSTQFIVIDSPEVLKELARLTARWLGRSARRLRNPLMRCIAIMRGMTTKEEFSRWVGQFELIAQRMDEGIDMVLRNAPALMLFHAGEKVRFAEANANLALQNATFAAQSLGLGSFYTGYVVTGARSDRAVRRLINLPDGHRVFAGLALGYPTIAFSHWIDRNPAKIKWI